MAELDEESYLDSLLGSIGDVEDIVTTKEMGVEKILENQLSKEDNDNVIDEPEEKEADKAEEPEVKEAESAEPEQSMDIDAISADELNSLLGKESEAPAADNNEAGDSATEESAVDESGNSDKPDFSETELSESDMERLKDMDLDNIIEQVKTDSASEDDLFDTQSDSKAEEASGKEADSQTAEQKEPASDGSGENIEIDKSVEKKLKSKDKKDGVMSVLKSVFFENEDDEIAEAVNGKKESEGDGKDKKKKKKSKKKDKKASKAEEITDELLAGERKTVDENQQLIDEVFGDKETLDENVAPQKGFIAKIKYRLEQFKKKNAEEERLEEEAEQRDIEERKKKKEEDKAAKAAKKEEAKKEKEAKPKKEPKPKKAKPKKEKKPKPEPKPEDILKIKPKSLIMFIFLIAGICVLTIVASTLISNNSASSSARGSYEVGSYDKAYEQLAGMNISKSDQSIYEKSSVVMYVQRQYESYQNYMEVNMYTEAINALVKGLERYNTYYNEAKQLGVDSALDEQKQQIYNAFNTSFNISQADADKLLQESQDNFTQYYVKIDKMGKAMKK